MPPKSTTEPDYPHLHVKVLMPDEGYILIIWPRDQGLPRWGEGIDIADHNLMVTHTRWSFESEEGDHLPVYLVYVCDDEDWDEDHWPAPPSMLPGGRHTRSGDIDLSPDIRV